jgi:hypothetical protein
VGGWGRVSVGPVLRASSFSSIALLRNSIPPSWAEPTPEPPRTRPRMASRRSEPEDQGEFAVRVLVESEILLIGGLNLPEWEDLNLGTTDVPTVAPPECQAERCRQGDLMSLLPRLELLLAHTGGHRPPLISEKKREEYCTLRHNEIGPEASAAGPSQVPMA